MATQPDGPERPTPRETDVLLAVEAMEEEKGGKSPTLRELGVRLGMSNVAVHGHVKALEEKGWLRRQGRKGVQILRYLGKPAQATEITVSVPVRGSIAAGKPLEAVETEGDSIAFPSSWVKGDCYALRVAGDSLKDDGIWSDDIVLVRRQDDVENGEIAVCLLENGTATLKHVHREKGRVRLQPANKDMAPIYVKNVSIQGLVLAVLRLY